MARKFLPYYNVGQSVGNGGSNSPDDVMLVQYLLSRIGKTPPHPLPPPPMPLAVNGVATPLLNEWILWFQKCNKAIGEQVLVDGRIDSSKSQGGSFYPPASGRTMFFLNTTFRRRFRAEHDALDLDPQCPMPLRAKFTAESDIYE